MKIQERKEDQYEKSIIILSKTLLQANVFRVCNQIFSNDFGIVFAMDSGLYDRSCDSNEGKESHLYMGTDYAPLLYRCNAFKYKGKSDGKQSIERYDKSDSS